VTRHDFALEWMADFETYHAALDRDTTYAATLSRSLSLVRLFLGLLGAFAASCASCKYSLLVLSDESGMRHREMLGSMYL